MTWPTIIRLAAVYAALGVFHWLLRRRFLTISFAPESAGKMLVALLGSIDLFSLWSIALLAIGYRVVGKVSKTAALGVVAVLWAVVVAGKVGLAAL